MSNVAIYNKGASPENVINYIVNIDSAQYQGRDDVVVNPNVSLIAHIPSRYWKHVDGAIVQMTAQEKIDLDNLEQSQIKERMRNAAVNLFDKSDAQLIRAVVIELLDYINKGHQDHNQLLQWLSLQTNLSNKAQLSNFQSPQATPQQARNAIKTRINDGEAD